MSFFDLIKLSNLNSLSKNKLRRQLISMIAIHKVLPTLTIMEFLLIIIIIIIHSKHIQEYFQNPHPRKYKS